MSLAFNPLIHFKLVFVCDVSRGWTSLFYMWVLSYTGSICRKDSFSCTLISLIAENQLTINIKVHFWTSYYIPLVMPWMWDLIISFEIRQCDQIDPSFTRPFWLFYTTSHFHLRFLMVDFCPEKYSTFWLSCCMS